MLKVGDTFECEFDCERPAFGTIHSESEVQSVNLSKDPAIIRMKTIFYMPSITDSEYGYAEVGSYDYETVRVFDCELFGDGSATYGITDLEAPDDYLDKVSELLGSNGLTGLAYELDWFITEWFLPELDAWICERL